MTALQSISLLAWEIQGLSFKLASVSQPGCLETGQAVAIFLSVRTKVAEIAIVSMTTDGFSFFLSHFLKVPV